MEIVLNLEAVSYITEVNQSAIEQQLQKLYRLSLLQRADDYRYYRLHPLLRDLGHQMLKDDRLRSRMVDYYQEKTENWEDDDMFAVDSGNIRGALSVASTLSLAEPYIHIANQFCPFLKTNGLYQEVSAYLEEAVVFARSLPTPYLLIDSLRNLGECYDVQGHAEQAEAALLEAWELAEASGDTHRLSLVALSIGSYYGQAGHLESSEQYLKTGERAARDNEDDYVLSAMLLRLSTCNVMLQKLDEALAIIDEGLAIARNIQNDDLVATFLTNRGRIYEQQGERFPARQDWLEALKFAKQAGYQERICRLVINIGNNFATVGRYSDAMPYLQEGLAIATEIRHALHIPSPWIYIGQCFLLQRRFDEAEHAYNQASSIDTIKQYDDLHAEVLWGHARIARERGDLAEAEKLAQQSLEIMREMNPYYVDEIEDWIEKLQSSQDDDSSDE